MHRSIHHQGANSFITQLTAYIDKAEHPWLNIIAHRASTLLQHFTNSKRLTMKINIREDIMVDIENAFSK